GGAGAGPPGPGLIFWVFPRWVSPRSHYCHERSSLKQHHTGELPVTDERVDETIHFIEVGAPPAHRQFVKERREKSIAVGEPDVAVVQIDVVNIRHRTARLGGK